MFMVGAVSVEVRVGARVAGALIGDGCVIGEYAVVEPGVIVGEGVTVGPHAWIGKGTHIGCNVRVGAGARIGEEGFGFALDTSGRWHRKPQFRGVVICDDVEVGANTVIARGSYRDTIIGRGTKIDAACFVAHNAIVGEDVLIIAGACVCGSAVIRDGAYLAPHSVICDHTEVGQNTLVALGAVVKDDVGDDWTVAGVPARHIGPSRISEIAQPYTGDAA